VRFPFAFRLFVQLAVSLTIANALAVFSGWTLATLILPALAGGILATRALARRDRSARVATCVGTLLLAWTMAVVIAAGLVIWFVFSKNGRLEPEYVAGLGMSVLYATLLGGGAGVITFLVIGQIARRLSRAEAA
jgi:hypothetical protein